MKHTIRVPHPEAGYFTPTEVARIIELSPRKVRQCIDEGVLEGYRVPVSLYRRVRRHALVEFIEQHLDADVETP